MQPAKQACVKGDIGNAIVNILRKTDFDSMTFTNRCILAVVALTDSQDVVAARIHLLVHWLRRK